MQRIGHWSGLQLPNLQPIPWFELLGITLDLVELGRQRYGLAGELTAVELKRLEQLSSECVHGVPHPIARAASGWLSAGLK